MTVLAMPRRTIEFMEAREWTSNSGRTLQESRRHEDVWISMMSIWELAKKVEKGQLVLDRSVDDWLDAATTLPGLHLAELTRPILVDSCRLPQPFHGDPADQIIAATARYLGAVLVTKDRKLREYSHVRAIW